MVAADDQSAAADELQSAFCFCVSIGVGVAMAFEAIFREDGSDFFGEEVDLICGERWVGDFLGLVGVGRECVAAGEEEEDGFESRHGMVKTGSVAELTIKQLLVRKSKQDIRFKGRFGYAPKRRRPIRNRHSAS